MGQKDIEIERVKISFNCFSKPGPLFQGAGLLMKAIIEEGSEATGQKMQMLALAEGAVPIHLVKALFIKSEDNRLLMQRQLSRHLISLWTAGNDAATELLQRILVS